MSNRTNSWVSALFVAGIDLLVPTISLAVSFDCSKAQSFREKSVCSNVELGKLDDQLSAAYKGAQGTWGDQQNLKDSQRKWMSEANQCPDEPCIAKAYRGRIDELDGADAEEGDNDNTQEPADEAKPADNVGRGNGPSQHTEQEHALNRQVEEGIQEAQESDRQGAERQRQQATRPEDERSTGGAAAAASSSVGQPPSPEEYCTRVQADPVVQQYVTLMSDAASNPEVQRTDFALDEGDLIYQWVFDKMKADPNGAWPMMTALNQCAYSLRNTKYLWVFTQGASEYRTALNGFERIAKGAAPEKRVDDSGNVVEVQRQVPAADMQVLEVPNVGSSANRGSNRGHYPVAALALYFDGASKVLDSVAKPVLLKLEEKIKQQVAQLEQSKQRVAVEDEINQHAAEEVKKGIALSEANEKALADASKAAEVAAEKEAEARRVELKRSVEAKPEPGADFSLKGLSFDVSLKAAEAVLSEINRNCFGQPLEGEENFLGNGEKINCWITLFNKDAEISVYFLDDHLKYITVPNLDGDDQVPHAVLSALAERFGVTPEVDVTRDERGGEDFTYEASIEDEKGNKFLLHGVGGDYVDAGGKKVSITTAATLFMVSHDMESVIERRKAEIAATRDAHQKAQTAKQKSDL